MPNNNDTLPIPGAPLEDGAEFAPEVEQPTQQQNSTNLPTVELVVNNVPSTNGNGHHPNQTKEPEKEEEVAPTDTSLNYTKEQAEAKIAEDLEAIEFLHQKTPLPLQSIFNLYERVVALAHIAKFDKDELINLINRQIRVEVKLHNASSDEDEKAKYKSDIASRFIQLAFIYKTDKGDYGAAIKQLRRAIQSNPSNASVYEQRINDFKIEESRHKVQSTVRRILGRK